MLGIPNFYDVAESLQLPCPRELGDKWPRGVPADEATNAIDLAALKVVADTFSSLGYSLIVIFNCGTTIGHSVDDIKSGSAIVEEACKVNNAKYWIHVDAAHLGNVLPFAEGVLGESVEFDFRIPQLNSLSVSGHKWWGIAAPCGVYVTKKKYY